MSAASRIRVLADAERAAIGRAVERASASNAVHFVACTTAAPVPDPLALHAACEDEERFFWERIESDESWVAWGVADAVEAAGRNRFARVAEWSEAVRCRIEWIGEARALTEPLLFGGFGFEDEASPAPEWTRFPPARFVLPRVIAQRSSAEGRWLSVTRVEPGARVEEAIADQEAALAEIERALVLARVPETSVTHVVSSATAGEAAAPAAGWPAGPEYIVRADRDHDVFRGQVARAVDEIEAGRLEKVVLARSLRVQHDGELDVSDFLGRLRGLYPQCVLVSLGRGPDSFLAATPELLVRVEGEVVSAAALAGSAARGRTPKEDRSLAEALLASEKERAEHQFVVDAICEALATRCVGTEAGDRPHLKPLFGIQHLETRVTARLPGALETPDSTTPARIGVLDLVEALHPTPAVAGVPRQASRDWLRKVEGLDRGWYAAPIGWLDAQGGGDFRVALRSAVIQNHTAEGTGDARGQANLFAGAGIVAGSLPDAELAETRVKLRALLAPLTEI